MEDNPTGGDKNIELSKITQVEDEDTGQEETELLGDDDDEERVERLRDPNASIVVPQGLNPDIEAEQEVRELEQKKDFLREFLKHTQLRVGKTGKIIGLRWKGKDVIVSAKDGYDYTDAKKLKSALDDFKDVLARAQIEHGNTAAAEVEEQFAHTTRKDVEQVLR